eukprot:CAMPEP_0179150004 /NCGR_PEP_ID=MMETSP0796-20121207/72711_1 /TAXON_ID=73915 /ORGANISM="Pyrodinium bahamense, Strain pbaha01" /LENGTH=372 /DNA_ID=CAMNT_0020850911 /DNA_START=156 /DNA_END=1274 /DNA_ORIENTATION=+
MPPGAHRAAAASMARPTAHVSPGLGKKTRVALASTWLARASGGFTTAAGDDLQHLADVARLAAVLHALALLPLLRLLDLIPLAVDHPMPSVRRLDAAPRGIGLQQDALGGQALDHFEVLLRAQRTAIEAYAEAQVNEPLCVLEAAVEAMHSPRRGAQHRAVLCEEVCEIRCSLGAAAMQEERKLQRPGKPCELQLKVPELHVTRAELQALVVQAALSNRHHAARAWRQQGATSHLQQRRAMPLRDLLRRPIELRATRRVYADSAIELGPVLLTVAAAAELEGVPRLLQAPRGDHDAVDASLLGAAQHSAEVCRVPLLLAVLSLEHGIQHVCADVSEHWHTTRAAGGLAQGAAVLALTGAGPRAPEAAAALEA